ncbi:MAG: T9SS type A sorting domain-containing protein [Phycisphaerae bacterium]|nr:T9SS type A sorting domain-containing protein [Saprospiraceae bacterium]
MKKIFLLLILCAWLAPHSLSARHILGGSMGYYYTPDGQLKIEMVIYQDCWITSAAFDSPAEIAVYKSSGELFTTFSLNDYDYKKIESDSNSCFSDFSSCIERGIYTFPVSLPDDGNTYLVVYQRCCRSTDLSNLINPNEIGFTIDVEITSQARLLKNNSPRWTADPMFNICVHEPIVLDLAVAEPEGDILLYSFCKPLVGGGPIVSTPDLFSCIGAKPTPPCPPPYDAVPFAVPTYSSNNPLGSAISQINAINGVWGITADYIGKFNYAVCVQEYRNGVLLSSVRRDMTLWVQDFVGTNETKGFATLTCSPNPVGDAMLLSTEMFEGKNIQIELADLSGKIWLAEKRMNVASKELLNITTLPAGVYLVRILAKGKTATGRFVHQ